MSNDINIGAISEALNDKMDRDTNNRASNIQVIIKTFEDGASGYRIWSDGYCEQWGLASAGNSSITFAKTFKDTNYNILITERGNWAGYVPRVDTVSTNAMTLKFDAFTGGSVQNWYWTVKGYLASGQY